VEPTSQETALHAAIFLRARPAGDLRLAQPRHAGSDERDTRTREDRAAIAALDAQRSIPGESVVNAALAHLRADLAALHSEERRDLVTVLCADISGRASFSSEVDAQDVQHIMHRHWSRLDQIILNQDGYMAKHIGDRVMAVWDVISPQENDPERATCVGQIRIRARRSSARRGALAEGSQNSGAVGHQPAKD
jgi:class 3 adenylate cyclase